MLHYTPGQGQAEENVSRRKFLHRVGVAAVGTSALTLGSFGHAAEEPPAKNSRKGEPIPLIHETDLFRPHIDPDDHFDLACVYALAHAAA